MKLINKLDLNGQIFLNSAINDESKASGKVEYALPVKSGILALKSDITDQHAFRFMGNATSVNVVSGSNASLTFTADQMAAAITASQDVLAETDFGGSGDARTLAANVKPEVNGYVFQVGAKEYASNGTEWIELGINMDLSDYYTKTEVNTLLTGYYTKTAADDLFATKAEVQENEEVVAQALNDHEGRLVAAETKLSTIEQGAEVNIIEGVKLSDSQSVLTPDANRNVTIPAATPGTDGTDGADGLMTSEDKYKLNNIAAGAEVNVQADWNETNSSSDAYIANKPTNLAATYLHTVNTDVASVTIAQTDHHCGTYPMVQVYLGYTLVNADVAVAQSAEGDVTVSWSSDIHPTSATPIKIRIVGAYSLPS